MIRTCPDCGWIYDDEFRSTICPHATFSANDGHNHFAHRPTSVLRPPLRRPGWRGLVRVMWDLWLVFFTGVVASVLLTLALLRQTPWWQVLALVAYLGWALRYLWRVAHRA